MLSLAVKADIHLAANRWYKRPSVSMMLKMEDQHALAFVWRLPYLYWSVSRLATGGSHLTISGSVHYMSSSRPCLEAGKVTRCRQHGMI